MQKKILLGFLVFVFLLLLASPLTVREGAYSGLVLWAGTVIPVLFPFLLASNMLTRLGAASGKWYAVLLGILCGYPIGAKAAADLVADGTVTKRQGQWLMGCCNLPSPMFLAGFVQLPRVTCALYAPVCLMLIPVLFFHAKPQEKTDSPISFGSLLEDAMEQSTRLMVRIGIYIMLFSILSAEIQTLAFLPLTLRVLLTGFCEMTVGIANAKAVGFSQSLTENLCTVFCTIGGLSGLAQTADVIKKSGLSIKPYFCMRVGYMFLALLFLYLF